MPKIEDITHYNNILQIIFSHSDYFPVYFRVPVASFTTYKHTMNTVVINRW